MSAVRDYADEIACASGRAWQSLIEAVPGGWVVRDGGALAAVTGVPLAGYNGVWSEASVVSARAVDNLLTQVAAAGVPYCMQLRPGWPAAIEEVALDHGLVRAQGEPIMVLDDPSRLDDAQHVRGLSLRELDPSEGFLHAAVVAHGFGDPEAPYVALMTPEVLTSAGMRCYVGEVGGRPVTTCMGVTVADCVAIFNVATLSEHRRKGYGAAITARAVGDGLAAGASWAWLSSSEAGLGVYTGLGFAVLECWDFWESKAS